MRKICVLMLLALWLAGGCSTDGGRTPESGRLRLGYMANITHAQAVLGVADGTLERAAGVRLDTRLFYAGPGAVSALMAGEIDALYVGPSPATNGFVRSQGALRILAGAASGGAVFVVQPGTDPTSLAGKKLATPGVANTQDISLRQYLARQGLRTREQGGSVLVSPMGGADMLNLFLQGHLDGAWVAEPWGARLEAVGGVIALDERDLWPDRMFATTLLVVSTRYLEANPQAVAGLLKGHFAMTAWIAQHPDAARQRLQAELARLQGKPLPDHVMNRAFSRVNFTTDPMVDSVREMAARAYRMGYLGAREPDLSGLFELSLLKEVGP